MSVRVSDLLERSQAILISGESNPEHQAAILALLSSYFLQSGKPGQADVLLARSLALTKSTPDVGLRASLLCDSAYAASLLGRLAQSQTAMDQRLALSRTDPIAGVRCLRDRAFIAQNANDPGAALDFTLQAQARLHESPVAKPDVEAELLASTMPPRSRSWLKLAAAKVRECSPFETTGELPASPDGHREIWLARADSRLSSGMNSIFSLDLSIRRSDRAASTLGA